MAKLFISHASQDKETARQLSNDLRVLGHSVWLDEWSIIVGQCISNEIEKALTDTQFLILLLSKNAVVSRWVDTEWRAAYWDELQSRSIIVLPVLLEKVQLPKLLQTKKYASFVLSYAVGFRELINAIEHYESTFSVAPPSALRPLRRKKQDDGIAPKIERTTPLRLVRESGAKTKSQVNNVINIGGSVTRSIVANKVQISGKGAPRMNYPAGSVGASVQMKNYLDYLIKRYYDYRKLTRALQRLVTRNGSITRRFTPRFSRSSKRKRSLFQSRNSNKNAPT